MSAEALDTGFVQERETGAFVLVAAAMTAPAMAEKLESAKFRWRRVDEKEWRNGLSRKLQAEAMVAGME